MPEYYQSESPLFEQVFEFLCGPKPYGLTDFVTLCASCFAGVGMAMRKMGSMAKPDVYIIKDGDTITVKTESTFKTSQFSFKLGEKFEENTLDGRKTQTLVSLKDDGSLVQEQEWDGKKTIITRKLVDGQLVVECDMNGVKCVRVYQKA
ncbi:fatty acid-binding protein 5-like [Athene cunicularia]|nr:fatty acid-binding protein 5-like [Athene cunicularia]